MLRSLLSIVAGYIVVSLLGTAGQHLFSSMPPLGSRPELGLGSLLVLLYEIAINTAGGAVTGVIAQRRPVLHAAVLGGLEIVLLASASGWMRQSAQIWPGWFEVALLLAVLPAAVLGGRLAAHFGPGRREAARDV